MPRVGTGSRGWWLGHSTGSRVWSEGPRAVAALLALAPPAIGPCTRPRSALRSLPFRRPCTVVSRRVAAAAERGSPRGLAPPAPQVQYVLSDKTGTLTQNVMGFVWASVEGNLYGTATSATNQWVWGLQGASAEP